MSNVNVLTCTILLIVNDAIDCNFSMLVLARQMNSKVLILNYQVKRRFSVSNFFNITPENIWSDSFTGKIILQREKEQCAIFIHAHFM